MGAGQSSEMEIGGSTMGYQVLRVYPNSPGSRAGLKAYFDFIVAIGNTRFDKEDGSLREILKASVDQKIKMVVFNTRSKSVREVDIIPTTGWGGNGLLGVSIKHSSFDRADERVWHVVEVDPGSPAHQAGFQANEDYVIGSDSILQENDDLYNLIEAHEGKALKLFVYNLKTDNCREVICHPNSRWGGRGYLGCEFGHGLLHRIPHAQNQNGLPPTTVGSRTNSTIGPTQTAQQPNPLSFQSQLAYQSLATSQSLPGQQRFQQALLDKHNLPQQTQTASEKTQSAEKPAQTPVPVLQTFSQLANVQYSQQQHSHQHQAQQPGHQPQQPHQPVQLQAQQPGQQPQQSQQTVQYQQEPKQPPQLGQKLQHPQQPVQYQQQPQQPVQYQQDLQQPGQQLQQPQQLAQHQPQQPGQLSGLTSQTQLMSVQSSWRPDI